MKITDDLMEAITCYHKIDTFVVNKDEWYTKEGRSKSMKNVLYVQQYGKRYLSGWSDVEQQAHSASQKASGRWAGGQAVS